MTCTTDDIKLLFAEFPQEDIHWRAQTVTKDGTKAMALAYLDARDVMDRLDQICGAENWQDSYTETQSGRVICTISIRIDGEWIAKADGAGSTAMEGEKGGMSDAFKRAAVKWGVGRYLYDMPAPWVPCECSEWNGKKQWKRWKDDPWKYVTPAKGTGASAAQQKRGLTEIDNDLLDCATVAAVDQCASEWQQKAINEGWSKDYKLAAAAKFQAARENIIKAQQKEAA